MITAFTLCCKCFWDLHINENIVTLLTLWSLQYLPISVIPSAISFADMSLLKMSFHPICKITASGVSSCIISLCFHPFDSSSYKWTKSRIAFLQTGIKFISSYVLYHTCTLSKCFPTKTNCFIVLGISWDEIVILFRKNKCISLRKSLNKWCRSLLGAIALLSILLLNAFLYSSMSLFILLLIQGSVTLFSLIKKGWYLLLTSI